jgi:dephospho-CoA kinase
MGALPMTTQPRAKPWILGLTGGIGSGKSTVGHFFSECGVDVVDTDEIAHALTGPNGQAILPLVRVFGPQCLRADGALDRVRMRTRVFSDPKARKQLEEVLHPLIFDASVRACAAAPLPYVVLAVPLLFETAHYRLLCHRTCVVDAPPSTQVERVMARSGLSEPEVWSIIHAQMSREARIAQSDDLINNNGDLAALRARVFALDGVYRQLLCGA